MMDWMQLADEIASAMGYGHTTMQVRAFAHGTVDEVRNGVATWGNTPSGHTISGLDASRMANLIMGYAGYPGITQQLMGYCIGVCNHVMGAGIVTYAGPPKNPPPEPLGWYLDGKISGLDGSACAELVRASAGYPHVSPKLLAECTAVVNHIMTNAEVNTGVIN